MEASHRAEPIVGKGYAGRVGVHHLHLGVAQILWSTYLVRARLLHAMTLLATTDKGVLQIAGEVGYDSATSLSRALRAWTGSTPSEYRARTQAADSGGEP